MIVITGKKANCEVARNRILAIQKELVSICTLVYFSLEIFDRWVYI